MPEDFKYRFRHKYLPSLSTVSHTRVRLVFYLHTRPPILFRALFSFEQI